MKSDPNFSNAFVIYDRGLKRKSTRRIRRFIERAITVLIVVVLAMLVLTFAAMAWREEGIEARALEAERKAIEAAQGSSQ